MWKEVVRNDEYAEPGDTHWVQGRDWLYYWNARRKTIRRYGVKTSVYEEVPYRSMPWPYHGSVVRTLTEIFSSKRDKVVSS